MINKAIKQAISILVLGTMSLSVMAQDYSELPLKDKFLYETEDTSIVVDEEDGISYAEYMTTRLPLYKGEDIVITSEDVITPLAQIDEVDGKRAVASLEMMPDVEWKVSVPESASYVMKVVFRQKNDSTRVAARNILIDGDSLFKETSGVLFEWGYVDSGDEILYDLVGDEIAPPQDMKVEFRTKTVIDSSGNYLNPFTFSLTEGEHIISLESVEQDMYVSEIILSAPKENLKSYKEVFAGYSGKNKATKTIKFQAETSVTDKSDGSMSRVSNSDPKTEPYKVGYTRLNTMGDLYWSKGEQALEWSFEVEEAGLYKIGMRFAQWANYSMPIYRQIEIDGEVPFSELTCYRFDFSNKWQYDELKGEDGSYWFYFDEGVHTIKMIVKQGPYTKMTDSLIEIAQKIANLYLKIIMVTGPVPDANYQYELEKNIPGLLDDIADIRDGLNEQLKAFEELGGEKSSNYNLIKQGISHVESLLKKPENIHKNLSDFTNVQSWASSVAQALTTHSLIFDYFNITASDEIPKYKSTFFEKFFASCYNFFISFSKDYDKVGETEGSNKKDAIVLDVWISRGTERTQIIKRLTEETFSKEKGVYINYNIIPADQINAGGINGLMLSVISGNPPDIAMGAGVATPIELAFRNSIFDLSEMEGFDEFKKENFVEELFTPMSYLGHVYGIPESMDFRIMLYRKDIVSLNDIPLPNTWEDLYQKTLPVLMQNQMNFFVPLDYSMFLYQQGGSYYNEDLTESALSTTEAYIAFKELVELYTSYGLEYTTNFFNRFRTGDLPIGIGGFGDYMMLSVAAPEIAGKWGIAKIPGHVKEDGTIDRKYSGSATSCSFIFKACKYKEEAYDFLTWWMSTDTQVKYASQCEATLGYNAKWNSANINTYTTALFREDDLNIIKSTWNDVREIPATIGGYFTTRHFNNAWNRVAVNNDLGYTIRESLEKASQDISAELKRKQTEYKDFIEEAKK